MRKERTIVRAALVHASTLLDPFAALMGNRVAVEVEADPVTAHVISATALTWHRYSAKVND